jgi:hypothetical protein
VCVCVRERGRHVDRERTLKLVRGRERERGRHVDRERTVKLVCERERKIEIEVEDMKRGKRNKSV